MELKNSVAESMDALNWFIGLIVVRNSSVARCKDWCQDLQSFSGTGLKQADLTAERQINEDKDSGP